MSCHDIILGIVHGDSWSQYSYFTMTQHNETLFIGLHTWLAK